MCVSLFSYQGSLLFSSDNFDSLSCSRLFVKNFFYFFQLLSKSSFSLSQATTPLLYHIFSGLSSTFLFIFSSFFEDLILWQKIKQAVLLTCFKRRRRDSNPRAAINDLLPFQGSPFGQLGYFSIKNGEGGIRTHAPFRTNGFQDRLVMTTSIPLHNT